MRWVFLLWVTLFALPVAAKAQTSQSEGNSLRSFNELFPGIGEEQRAAVFSEGGLIRPLGDNESLKMIPALSLGVDFHTIVMQNTPNFLVEILAVVPHARRTLNKLDAYNVLGRVRDLQGRLYFSHTRQEEVPLFEEVTRLESGTRIIPIPDPPPASEVPLLETVFMRIKDVNFGNTFYRGDFSVHPYGLIYRIVNFRSINMLFVTVMREENFSATLYMEPLTEGMLIYAVAGASVSDFVAKRIDIPSSITKRAAVFLGWVSDGLRAIAR